MSCFGSAWALARCRAAAARCRRSGPTRGDPCWPALPRFDRIPSRNSPEPFLTISASRSCPIRGRPGYLRCLEPSNLLAISLRYQARMVAGLATRATSARALGPSRLPISASVDLSGLDKRSRGGRCHRRIRFPQSNTHSGGAIPG